VGYIWAKDKSFSNSKQSLQLVKLPSPEMKYQKICTTWFHSVTEHSLINLLPKCKSLRHQWFKGCVCPVHVDRTITVFFYWFNFIADHYDGLYSLTNVSSQSTDCQLC